METQPTRDYYEILGVSRTATQQEIEEAHQKLVAELRASDAPEASNRLIEVRKAHIVLGDLKKRVRYDASVADAQSGGRRRRRHDHHANAGAWLDSILNLLALFKR